MFNLESKAFLLLLLLVPLLLLWQRFLSKRGERYIFFSSKKLFPASPSALKLFLIRSLPASKLVALVLFTVALGRPQWIYTYRIQQNPGIDILLVLDISGSMASVDFKPKNRLEVAKEVIGQFVENRKSDHLGLVTFAATSYTRCPLTVDYEMLMFFLNEAQIGDIEDGTAIGMALATAVNRLRHSRVKTKIIILLTDGNNNRGEIDPRDAARMAQDFNIKIYTIGAGTRGQAPYPVMDSFGRRQYVMINVEIDEVLLQELAATTSGLYFRATDKDSLQKIFSEIDRWEKSKIAVRNYFETTELYGYFIAGGLLLLLFAQIAEKTFLGSLP